MVGRTRPSAKALSRRVYILAALFFLATATGAFLMKHFLDTRKKEYLQRIIAEGTKVPVDVVSCRIENYFFGLVKRSEFRFVSTGGAINPDPGNNKYTVYTNPGYCGTYAAGDRLDGVIYRDRLYIAQFIPNAYYHTYVPFIFLIVAGTVLPLAFIAMSKLAIAIITNDRESNSLSG